MYYNLLHNRYLKREKGIFLLIDPDKHSSESLKKAVLAGEKANVLMYLVGGSITCKSIEWVVKLIKSLSKKNVFLFPGSTIQLTNLADGILFISLISGRNPELLIGNHVIAAPFLKQTNLEVISTGYMLIEGGTYTSVEYMSNTRPIPALKADIAVATAIASEMLGHKLVYLDTGSGANKTVPIEIIQKISDSISIPLIVGGGIKSFEQALAIFKSGADIIVIGTACEQNPDLLIEISKAII